MYLKVLIDASWTSPSMQPPWQSWKEAQKRMLLSASARSSTGWQTTEWSGRRSAATHPRRQNTTLTLNSSGAEAVAVGTLRPLALNRRLFTRFEGTFSCVFESFGFLRGNLYEKPLESTAK